jgi:small ligand-binding sensory domain FIST
MYTQNQMQWVSALSTRPSLESALKEVVEQADRDLEGQPDLALIFISSAFASEYSRLMPLLRELLPVPAILGCGGEESSARTGAASPKKSRDLRQSA